ncbi:unnamed protein product, partial [Protopolystoma xenopodis]
KLSRLLLECGVPFVHLNVKTPKNETNLPGLKAWQIPRGVHQRNIGLNWLRKNKRLGIDNGVLYIADDDNVYDLRLFKEMRYTKRVSTWPVAFAGEMPVEGCVTTADNPDSVSYFRHVVAPWRPFPIDMSAFAVNLNLVLSHPNALFRFTTIPAMQESIFLRALGINDSNEFEPKANGCTEVG